MMEEELKRRITSENYVDFLVDARVNLDEVLETFTDSIFQVLNEAVGVVYVPIEEYSIEDLGRVQFTAIPNLNGLVSIESLESSGVFDIRESVNFNLMGNGVLVGIIDTGIDYTNPIFKYEDGTTRIASIWDQTIDSNDRYPFNYYFGREYLREEINEALASSDPLSIVPSRDEHGHGTMLAGVAAGRDVEEEGFYGVAPASELVVVKLRQAKQVWRDFFVIPDDSVCFQSNHVMWGIQYCIEYARSVNRPIAICLGIGTSQEAHDGRSYLSNFTTIVSDFSECAIVVAAGNEGNMGRHFSDTIESGLNSVLVELNVGDEEGFTMELWGQSPGIFSIDILTPNGEYIPRIPPQLRVHRVITFVFEETIIYVDYHTVELDTGDQLILLRFQKPTPGLWQFNVYSRGDIESRFDIWLPMGDFISDETFFLKPDIYTTVLAPGTAVGPITVTAYNPSNENLYINASRGFNRVGDIVPELAAPGVNYLAPTLSNGFGLYTGTSVSAAHTTGIAALMLEWGIVDGNYPGINTIVIKKFLMRGARRTSALTYPNRDWGYGIIDIFNTFDIVRLNI